MKILVLGATGRTGRIFTRKALEEGHAVTAYVRNPDKALSLLGAHQNLTIVPGTLDDAERLAAASSGQDVMVSILGQKRCENFSPPRSCRSVCLSSCKQSRAQA